MLDDEKIKKIDTILLQELVPALGCTEPIAIAYAAALCRKTLGGIPDRMNVSCSGNIIKNVKGVVVPNSGGLRGIEAAAGIGTIAGNPDNGLEVLSQVHEEQIEQTKVFMQNHTITVALLQSTSKLHIVVEMFSSADGTALVEIRDRHTNVTRIQKNGKPAACPRPGSGDQPEAAGTIPHGLLSIDTIVDYTVHYDHSAVNYLLEREIRYNTAISREGLKNRWGAGIGRKILAEYKNDVRTKAKAAAAAGSDARMSGCDLPVVINSGSGNQGITISLPIIEYARYVQASHDALLRALILGNLIAIHEKEHIGCLSAYCGAVTAACGAGAGITWLCGGSIEQIDNTITNTLADLSGVLCDGAKPSCAIKIASAVDAAILGHSLAMDNTVFQPGEGIVKNDIEETIRGIGKIASEGMVETDQKILEVMISKPLP
jgi:L-cysteine desulfidase